MIHFIKILSYELKPKDEDIFEYLSNVTSQKIDPPSTSKEKLDIRCDVLFHSPLKRAVECIERSENTKYVALNGLKEIPFDLKSFCSKADWEKEKSIIVRRKFKENFEKDTLLIKRADIFSEIETLLGEIGKRKNQDVVVLSHSFRLKIIQAYLETKGKLIHNPKLLRKFILDNQKTFEFGKGFSVSSVEF